MKVFPDADGGATEASILNALEDTAVLGADVVNLSLGSATDLLMTAPPPALFTSG